jgi:hypothetical protein
VEYSHTDCVVLFPCFEPRAIPRTVLDTCPDAKSFNVRNEVVSLEAGGGGGREKRIFAIQ